MSEGGFLRSGYIVLGLANLMHWLHHIQLTLFALLCLLMSHKTSLAIYALVYTCIFSVLISVFNKCENTLLICMKITDLFSNEKKKNENYDFMLKNCQKLLPF